MASSKIDICNIALAMIGADSIRDFGPENKRSRLCERFYDSTRDYLLAMHDWHFARSFKKLKELVIPEDEQMEGMHSYELPVDCLTPRSLYPRGSREQWEVLGGTLVTSQTTEIGLYYTKKELNVTLFSHEFSQLLALALAAKLAPPVAQDLKLASSLYEQYKIETKDAWENSANVGEDYRSYDEDPLNDTFVNPDIAIESRLPRIIT